MRYIKGVKKIATSIRLTPEAARLLKRLAKKRGLSQAGVIETLVREASTSRADQRLLVDALLNPPPATPALKAAFKRHRPGSLRGDDLK